jgi:hypothetical protein
VSAMMLLQMIATFDSCDLQIIVEIQLPMFSKHSTAGHHPTIQTRLNLHPADI